MKKLIFGCGHWCVKYLDSLENNYSEICAFLDNDKSLWGKKLYGIAEVFPPDKLKELAYDQIVVCSNTTDSAREQIKSQLLDFGAVLENIRFFPERREKTDYISRLLFFKNLATYLHENQIQGDVAEGGVWIGHTASYMNRYFADRKLYLFDTFEGIPEKAMRFDAENNSQFNQKVYSFIDHTPTLDIVLSKMTYPNNVIIRKGYFPDTATDLPDMFAFVHVDFGLYLPEKAAIDIFYDKLAVGGVMLFETYYSSFIHSTRKAIADFEKERGIKLRMLPIGSTTSAMFMKQ